MKTQTSLEQAISYLFDNPDSEYDAFIREIVKMRHIDRVHNLALVRDRGRKPSYFQDYAYQVVEIDRLINSLKQCNIWFDSIYLNWLLYETCNDQKEINKYFSFFVNSTQCGSFLDLIQINRYECYGAFMSCMVLLEKHYILDFDGFFRTFLFKIAIMSGYTYITYHCDKDPVKSAEIYSNYARLFDLFKFDIFGVVRDYVSFGIVEYIYCYGMYNAYYYMPNHHPRLIKDDYRTSAFMMYSNFTTDHVTREGLEASFQESINLGFEMSKNLYEKLIDNFSVDQTLGHGLITILDIFNDLCSKVIIKTNQDVKSFDIRIFDKYNQIESYREFGIIDFPYQKTRIHYQQLLDNLKINTNGIHKENVNRSGSIITIDPYPYLIEYSLPYNSKKAKDSSIQWLKIHINNNEELYFIEVFGLNIYEFFLDVNRAQSFYGIPGKASNFVKNAIGMVSRFSIFVGTEWDFEHGFDEVTNN